MLGKKVNHLQTRFFIIDVYMENNDENDYSKNDPHESWVMLLIVHSFLLLVISFQTLSPPLFLTQLR